ncbi:uncharacterized protein [Diadema setosum]|uniref:uncharacterized protein n=1 Tax=Diadema setosum TaxID=31175 RepID=UPI003B3AD3BE
MRVDEGNRTVPEEVVVTALRPDMVLVARSVHRLAMVELTVPWETRIDEARERKLDRYAELREEYDALDTRVQCGADDEKSLASEASSQTQSGPGKLRPLAKVLSMCARTDTSVECNSWSHGNVPLIRGEECRICGGRFANLARHMQLHEGRKIWQCKWCSKDFWTKLGLNKHARIVHPEEVQLHFGQSIYKYEMCVNEWNLNKHKKLHSQETLAWRNMSKCECSSRCFPHGWNLETHRKSQVLKHDYVHAPRQGEGQNGVLEQFPKPSICLICRKSCGTPYRLKKHMLIHNEEADAESCLISFPLPSGRGKSKFALN